jgi:hypothetical protein
MLRDPVTAGIDLIGKAIDRFVPDEKAAAEAKLALYQAERAGDLREVEVALSAILQDSKSADPWTSRARPSFLYTVYVMLLTGIPMGVLSAFDPEAAKAVADGFKLWLQAIPTELYVLFGTVMTGYGISRTVEKVKGVA